ncbi:ricin-type beta-trefoil lectin domain protein [Streptomyces cynarae]|uniref:ricin-type beta-trefoil lectin domain protein n=1 Tax=Streptomyces cynarae TaxID=2981134 RepID=UPI00406CDD7F
MNEYDEAVDDIGVRLGATSGRSARARFAAAVAAAVPMVIRPSDHAGPGDKGRLRTSARSATARPHGRSRLLTSRVWIVPALGCLLLGGVAMPASAASQPGQAVGGDGWVLSTTDTSKNYAPTFVGNGYLAARVPAAGEGYSSTPITTQSELAGFYAQRAGQIEQRASLPTWTTLGFGRSGDAQPSTTIDPATDGTTSNYKQSLDLRTGVLTTSYDWTSPAGDTTSLTYEVSANRADGHLGTVSLRAVPHWSGTATAMDAFDGRGLDHASATDPHVDGKTGTLSETVVTDGELVTAGLNSVLRVDGKTVPTQAIAAAGDGTAGQSATFPVQAGQSIQITKYVGIASSVDTDRKLAAATPQEAAATTAARAASSGYQTALARNDQEWSRLWQSSISIPGDTTMSGQIHASMFYLLASMRPGVTWSTSPGGLSSDGYNGHVFWDMETWMYPALLAQYPDIAVGANTYRQKLLNAAYLAAAQLSTPSHPIKGAKFPWESALTGSEQTPPPYPEGEQELHINSDIALAQWQYYEASGDTTWLRDKAWPVLKGIADYWATRAVPDPAGGYDINDVMGPDEYHENVNNSVTTNAGAQASLRIAIQAARILGLTADPAWGKVADGLKIPVDKTLNIHPEFDGYDGQTVKQADVTLLQYPWNVPMPATLAQNDLDYYAAHTDSNGPSMTDAIAAIDSAALGSSGCQVYSYLKSSAAPFLTAPFNQWYETRNGGAFDFTTGEGGYLQEFLYGFTGLRWGTDAVTVDPFLPTQLPGVDITGVKWHGSTFDISVGQQSTTLTLRSGPALAVRDRAGTLHRVTGSAPLQMPTRHPAPTAQPFSCTGPITSAAAPSRCVDIKYGNSSDGTPLDLYDCNGTAAQDWTRPGNGTVMAAGKCMDVRDGSSTDGTPVQIYTCNGSPSQQWTYDQDTGELKAFGKCLATSDGGTSNGTPLVIDTCDGSTTQQWHLPS